jgi:hypothetical protein
VDRHQHPEAALYDRHQQVWPLPYQAVQQWRADNILLPVAEYGVTWTVAGAETFVRQLASLFQAYNRVLWENFPYCRDCGGQCCVVDASDVRPFDLLAIALLGEVPPHVPAQISAGSRTCIYLTHDGGAPHCSWPAGWRTIKCWSFYCLGSGPWPASANLNMLQRAVTTALHTVVETMLPEPLRRYEQITRTCLSDHLEDPVDFANALHGALDALFVAPFCQHYPLAAQPALAETGPRVANLFLLEEEVAEFISTAMITLEETASNEQSTLDAQLWTDLELLAWLVESRPPNARTQLQSLAQRYTYPDSAPLGRQLHAQLVRLLAVWRG